MQLPQKTLNTIIKNTPIPAIDLILTQNNKILLGKRTNQPAQGYWFVPGGRIQKNETIQQALQRISQQEIGTTITTPNITGIHEHHYHNSTINNTTPTHYITITTTHTMPPNWQPKPDQQHTELTWMTPTQIQNHPQVHQYTKNYINHNNIKPQTTTPTELTNTLKNLLNSLQNNPQPLAQKLHQTLTTWITQNGLQSQNGPITTL